MAGFFVGVVQTTIGSALGFCLGILAFWYQQKYQTKRQAEKEWRDGVDALKRLKIAAYANIEAMALMKIQFSDFLLQDIKKIGKELNYIYEVPPARREEKLVKLQKFSERSVYFYKSLPKVPVMLPPGVGEYSVLGTDMPALSLFVHRAVGTMDELNERIVSRTAFISEFAREGESGVGISSARFIYFSRMLTDQGKAICSHSDDALGFWKLVIDQVKAYETHEAERVQFPEYELPQKVLTAMPEEERFPWLRKQLVTFEET